MHLPAAALPLAVALALLIETAALAAPPAPPPTLAPAPSVYPAAFVDRPLTLAARTLSPYFAGRYAHAEGFEITLDDGLFDLGVAWGVTDDVTLYVQPASIVVEHGDSFFGTTYTRAHFGTARLGGVFRIAHGKNVEFGFRGELGGIGKEPAIHVTAGLPLVIHTTAPGALRFETGLFGSASLPIADSQFDHDGPDGGITAVRHALPGFPLRFIPDPGIPARLTVQLATPFSITAGSGLSVYSFAFGNVSVPLDAVLRFTIPRRDGSPVADLELGAGLPMLYPLGTDIVEAGLQARLFLPL